MVKTSDCPRSICIGEKKRKREKVTEDTSEKTTLKGWPACYWDSCWCSEWSAHQQTLKGDDDEEEPPKILRTEKSATGRSGDTCPGAEAAWIPVP